VSGVRCTLLGVGAMASPRYRPAGVLITDMGWHVMIDGGPGAQPSGHVDAWLVSDAESELKGHIRRLARAAGVEPHVGPFARAGSSIEPLPVVHTNHPTYGYLIEGAGRRVVWAPEFFTFPPWAGDADLMFAEAAAWRRPIRFARGVGGHASVLEVSEQALEAGVRRLVFAHIGRPTIRAIEAGLRPPFGEFGVEGRTYSVAGLPSVSGHTLRGPGDEPIESG
jgi:Beta-lactamase superfamily domain